MAFQDRIMAAFNALTGKVQPQGKGQPNPFFYASPISGAPAQKFSIDPLKLRQFSETVICRRAIDYIRNQVAKLEWDIKPQKGKKFTAQQKKQIEIAKNVFNNPNGDDNWSTWIGSMIEDMLVLGMGTSEIKKIDNADQPFLFYPIDAGSVQFYLAWNGSPNEPRYAQVDYKGHYIDFKPGEMIVMKHNPRSSTPFGLAPVEVAFQQVTYFIDAQAYSGKTASNAVPRKLLFMGSEITNDQLREFRMYFRDEIEGRSHMPIVGGTDDVKTLELGQDGDQSLFLQWQSFLVALIANAFNLDIMKFNAIIGINRSTGDTLDDASDEGAIIPMCNQIEHYMNQVLGLFELQDVAEFKFRLTSSYTDRKSLAVIHQIYATQDVMTIDEMRAEAGLDPLPVDPKTGKGKGIYTLSEYRAIYGGQVTLTDAVGVDQDTGTTNPNSVAGQKATQDPNGNGGNNGVNGTPAPKEKSSNQRNDKGTDITL